MLILPFCKTCQRNNVAAREYYNEVDYVKPFCCKTCQRNNVAAREYYNEVDYVKPFWSFTFYSILN